MKRDSRPFTVIGQHCLTTGPISEDLVRPIQRDVSAEITHGASPAKQCVLRGCCYGVRTVDNLAVTARVYSRGEGNKGSVYALENMSKVDAPCRPSASLKFTIDNILNLKTSGRGSDSCHPQGEHDVSATTTCQGRILQSNLEGPAAHRRHELDESGKCLYGDYLIHITVTHRLLYAPAGDTV